MYTQSDQLASMEMIWKSKNSRCYIFWDHHPPPANQAATDAVWTTLMTKEKATKASENLTKAMINRHLLKTIEWRCAAGYVLTAGGGGGGVWGWGWELWMWVESAWSDCGVGESLWGWWLLRAQAPKLLCHPTKPTPVIFKVPSRSPRPSSSPSGFRPAPVYC